MRNAVLSNSYLRAIGERQIRKDLLGEVALIYDPIRHLFMNKSAQSYIYIHTQGFCALSRTDLRVAQADERSRRYCILHDTRSVQRHITL